MVKIFTEILIIGMPIIAYWIGAISLSRLSDAMLVLGVLGSVMIIFSIIGIRLPLGHISQPSSLKDIVAIENTGRNRAPFYLLQILIISVTPLTFGILIKLLS